MKTSIFPFLFSLAFLWGCTTNESDKIKAFIPGLYARAFEDSITETTKTVGIDTLIIKKITEAGSEVYEIERRMKFQRTVDGILSPQEYKTETWKGIYDKDKKVIQETTKGKIISFIPENNVLLVNATEYKKLK